jgi:hypothetical protein
MSDRIGAFYVILEEPIKDEDADEIKKAIEMINGVLKVEERISDPLLEYSAVERFKFELWKKLKEFMFKE